MDQQVWDQSDLAVEIVASHIEELVGLTRSADLSVQVYAAKQLKAFVRLYRELTGCSEGEAAARFLQ